MATTTTGLLLFWDRRRAACLRRQSLRDHLAEVGGHLPRPRPLRRSARPTPTIYRPSPRPFRVNRPRTIQARPACWSPRPAGTAKGGRSGAARRECSGQSRPATGPRPASRHGRQASTATRARANNGRPRLKQSHLGWRQRRHPQHKQGCLRARCRTRLPSPLPRRPLPLPYALDGMPKRHLRTPRIAGPGLDGDQHQPRTPCLLRRRQRPVQKACQSQSLLNLPASRIRQLLNSARHGLPQ